MGKRAKKNNFWRNLILFNIFVVIVFVILAFKVIDNTTKYPSLESLIKNSNTDIITDHFQDETNKDETNKDENNKDENNKDKNNNEVTIINENAEPSNSTFTEQEEPKTNEVAVQSQKTMYDTIARGLLEGSRRIDLSDFPEAKNAQTVFDLAERAVRENPLILYYEGAQHWTNGIFEPSYFKDQNTIMNHRKQLEKELDKIIANVIKGQMNDFQKQKAIHDYIVNHARYDSYNYNNNTIPPESYNAYGVLIKGVGVCEGYAGGMKLLLDKVGIENQIVVGVAGGENHAWNLVKIAGRYYHVDATWNDPVMEDGSDVLRYDYFNLTDSEIGKEHTWDRNKYPAATSTKHNYHYYNGLVVGNYNEFYNKVETAVINKNASMELKILNYNQNTYDLKRAIDEVVMNRGSEVTLASYSFSMNEKQGILRVQFRYR
ncbi:transglutaminase domain-containing protein [Serpentinicella sp. ANB-PHB4]|uniref:transglutaminase domain-containing protein n=1 Tax=Serpentinicella sp. ANB-PHB4 TaxID=3074076 RepID=UPI002863EA28|nr:transglutaminase domain-containing protein [Serpentinicella sp. ANB-PHB4]MDR5659732.1 transglutaminase domain-containing protein [Serpentinicella sp. ANB-PHB4]